MKLYLNKTTTKESPPSLTYSSPSIPNELDGIELTYQELPLVESIDPFFNHFFNTSFSEPYWYRDEEGKLVYRKVIK